MLVTGPKIRKEPDKQDAKLFSTSSDKFKILANSGIIKFDCNCTGQYIVEKKKTCTYKIYRTLKRWHGRYMGIKRCHRAHKVLSWTF